MVRILVTVIISALVGGALGVTQYSAATGGYKESFEGTLLSTAEQTGEYDAAAPTGGTPQVEVVGGTSYDFGSMMHGETMSRDFVVRNVGTAPLVLEKAGSTCKCTVGDMEKNMLNPNEETKVKMTWTAESIVPMYGQSATFKTNDPEMAELKFSVEGQITNSFVIEPRSLSFGDLSVTNAAEKTFYVFSYLKDSNELKEFSWTTPETRNLISFESQPIPVNETPYERHKTASMAHKVTVKIAPGLPLGPLSARVQFRTDREDKVGLLELPVTGRVTSDLAIFGGGSFNADLNLLNIGNVKSSQGATVGVVLAVQGESRDTIELRIESCEPQEALKVTLGEPKLVGNRKLYQIQVEVPKGAPEVFYPGTGKGTYGKIVIKTNHETMQEMPIYVRLVVVK